MYQSQNTSSNSQSNQMMTSISSLPTKETHNNFQHSTNNIPLSQPLQNTVSQPQNEILGQQKVSTPSYNPNVNTSHQTQPTQNNQTTSSQTQSLNSIPTEDIRDIMNNVHNAQDTAATQLPIRDIPRSQQQLVSDVQSQPNYIPKQASHDTKNKFIEHFHQKEELKNVEFQKHMYETTVLNQLLDRLYIPIVFACMFFIFTIPSFNIKLYSILPFLFVKETKLSIYGNLFKALVFGFISLSSLYAFEKLEL